MDREHCLPKQRSCQWPATVLHVLCSVSVCPANDYYMIASPWKCCLRKCHKQGKEEEGAVVDVWMKLKMARSGTVPDSSEWGSLNFPTSFQITNNFQNNISPLSDVFFFFHPVEVKEKKSSTSCQASLEATKSPRLLGREGKGSY